MSVVMTTRLQETVLDNRWTSEFFNPSYKFVANKTYEWTRIGRLLKKCQYGLSVKMNEVGLGHKIYRLNEIENCFLNSDAAKYAPISKREREEYSLCHNDILFCRTNGNINYVGRTGILKDNVNAVFASYLVRVQTNTAFLLPEFLTIYLNTQFGRKQIIRRAMFSNQVNVSAAELKKVPIPLIDLHIQLKVADIVNEAFNLKKQSEFLYAQAEHLLVQELGLEIKFEKTIGYEASFSETLSFLRIDGEYFRPRYRQIRKLITRYDNGYEPLLANTISIRPNIDPHKQPQENFNYIELANINSSIGVVQNSSGIKGKDVPSRAKRRISAGDIVASSVVGSVDKAALISENEDGFLASTGFFQFRSLTYSPEFLLLLLRNMIVTEQLKQQATGGILSAVPDANLRYLIIPKIPKPIQKEITKLVKNSHNNYRQSQQLLTQAKQQVEKLIEQGVK